MTERTMTTDRNRIGDAMIHLLRAIKDRKEDERATEFQPGDSQYDAMHALVDLFEITRSLAIQPMHPRPEEITELTGAAARFGDAMIRVEAETKRIQRDGSADSFTVRISRADGQTVNVGPYPLRYIAERAAAYFQSCATRVEGARDATYETVLYDEKATNRVGDVPAGTDALVMLMSTGDDTFGDFPDLYARLCARHTDTVAREAWAKAGRAFDAAYITGI